MRNLILAAFLFLLSPGAQVLSAQEAQPTPAAENTPPLQVVEGVSRPEKISGEPPRYTEIARKAGVQGTVIVEAVIDEHGNVTNTRILQGLPLGLSMSALETLKTWRFEPAVFEGRSVKVYYTLTVNFRVEDAPIYGRQFRKFLVANTDFAIAMATPRYQDAAQLLDRLAAEQPTASEVRLARCYLLLEQGLLKEAWQEAQSYHGPDPFELPYVTGLFAARKVAEDKALSPEARAEMIELGLQAETQALTIKTDAITPVIYKIQLLREKAKLASDPKERKALTAEADQLLKRVKKFYSQRGLKDPFAADN
jgi:TonB family protein